MIDRTHDLPVTRQCQILELARPTAYYVSIQTSAESLAIMRQMDQLHLEYPFAGGRMLRDQRIHRVAQKTGDPDQHGRKGVLAGQRVR